MGGTALKRKARRNKTRVKTRNHILKVQGFKPVIKMVDVEAIKEEFKANSSKKPSKAKVEKAKDEVIVKTLTESTPPAKEAKPVKKEAEKVVTESTAQTAKAKDKKAPAKKPAAKKPAAKKPAAKKEKVAAKAKDVEGKA